MKIWFYNSDDENIFNNLFFYLSHDPKLYVDYLYHGRIECNISIDSISTFYKL